MLMVMVKLKLANLHLTLTNFKGERSRSFSIQLQNKMKNWVTLHFAICQHLHWHFLFFYYEMVIKIMRIIIAFMEMFATKSNGIILDYHHVFVCKIYYRIARHKWKFFQ